MNELNLKQAAKLLVERLNNTMGFDSSIEVERAEDARDLISTNAEDVLKEMGIPEEQLDDALDELCAEIRYVPEHYQLEKGVAR